MPYKVISEKIKLPKEYDRRVKLTDDDKENIKRLHKEGHGIREIARRYANKCSRRLIQFTIFPERLETVSSQFKARRADGRYKPTKEEWAKTMREHRSYKHSLYKKGLIK